MDSGRFGGKDTDLCVAYSPDTGIAGFCAPIVLRELKWREEEAGAPMTSANEKDAGQM